MSSILQQLKTCYSLGSVQNVMQKQRFFFLVLCVFGFFSFFLGVFWVFFFCTEVVLRTQSSHPESEVMACVTRAQENWQETRSP